MTKNEIVASFMGLPLTKSMLKFTGGFEDVPFQRWKYHSDYNLLMDVWVKFRDLKYQECDDAHLRWCETIRPLITDGTITEAFDGLVKGIEWYNSLQK